MPCDSKSSSRCIISAIAITLGSIFAFCLAMRAFPQFGERVKAHLPDM